MLEVAVRERDRVSIALLHKAAFVDNKVLRIKPLQPRVTGKIVKRTKRLF
jgi:hypothetical protein